MYVFIELQKHERKFGRTRNAVGTRTIVLPNFHECFYNSIETGISFIKHRNEEKKNKLSPSSYRNMILTNQRAYSLRFSNAIQLVRAMGLNWIEWVTNKKVGLTWENEPGILRKMGLP